MAKVKKSDRETRSPSELFDLKIPADEEAVLVDRTRTVAPPQRSRALKAIEQLTPSQMKPDRFQPRPLLPLDIEKMYFAGEIDCYKAAAEWLKLSKKDTGILNTIDELLGMGDSFEEHGQIKPITGYYTPLKDGAYIFTIETGERRFWAACLRSSRDKAKEEPLLRVEVVENPSRHRQVLENRHASPPNAVAQAREIAAIILDEVGLEPDPGLADPYDYFRQAIKIRKSKGIWEKLEHLMRLSRPRMVTILGILELPTLILEVANWNNIPARVLLEILSRSPEEWQPLFDLAIRNGLTSEEVANATPPITTSLKSHRKQERGKILPEQNALRGIRRFSNTISRVDGRNRGRILTELANEMMVKGDAEDILPLLEELAKLLRARLERSD